uniref:Minor capsid protein P9 transmembrane helices domain-containing protein n=1 Tax=viral metagenome TaxID=1070528 RepID=A0A6C0IIS4_9ZZZZ
MKIYKSIHYMSALKSSSTSDSTVLNEAEFEKKQEEVSHLNPLSAPNSEDIIPFWATNPNILFDNKYLLEFFPVSEMTYNQKLNAITRTVIILSLLTFFTSSNIRVIIVSVITLFAIFILHYYHLKESTNKKKSTLLKEGFANPAMDYLEAEDINIPDDVFDKPTTENPFSNVLMTDYDYNPNKKPAPPAFNKNVNEKILEDAKQLVINSNPGQPDIADKLFKDLGEQYVFEQSLRPFHSNPNTTIPNDQEAFAEFCYGSMVSCKEGNPFACARNLTRHTN